MYVNYPHNYYEQQHHQQQQQQPGPVHEHSTVPYYQYNIPQHQQQFVQQSPPHMIEQVNSNGGSHQIANDYMNQEYNYNNNNIQPPCESAPIICTPPEWAVQAKGESRLEPIGDTAIAHRSVDLSTQRWFRIGRSPISDIPLLHTTSSRNHALIFHHPNGACYLMDCKSVHGTYIDGVRMESYPHPPKKVRRGALIRFGGPGSPTFVLKRFSNEFHSFVRDMDFVAHSFSNTQQSCHAPETTPSPHPTLISESSSEEEDETTPKKLSVRSQYFRHPQHFLYHVRSRRDYHSKKELDILACVRGDGGGVACIAEQSDAPDAALLLLNTRINALGERGIFSTDRRNLLRKVKNRFSSLSTHTVPTTDCVDNQHAIGRKRSRGYSFDEHIEKKYKSILATSYIPYLEQNATLDYAAPQSTTNTTRTTRIRFSQENELFYPQPITPEDVSVDNVQS